MTIKNRIEKLERKYGATSEQERNEVIELYRELGVQLDERDVPDGFTIKELLASCQGRVLRPSNITPPSSGQ